MKKNLLTHFFCFFIFSLICHAQIKEQHPIIQKDKNDNIYSVEFSSSEANIPANAKSFFTEYLKTTVEDQFKNIPHKSKRPDVIHEHYDQYYKGVKVDGAGYNFHYKNGKMYFANGHFVKIKDLNIMPSISSDKALLAFLNAKFINKNEVNDTVITLLIKEISLISLSDTLIEPKLVYRIYLESDNPNNNEVGFIDANSGKLILTEPRLLDLQGTFVTRYSGSRQADTDPILGGGHRLFDNTRGATIHTLSLQNNSATLNNAIELTDNDNNWTSLEHSGNNNDMGLDVHWALQGIYDYLSNAHSIASFNDANAPINAYVRHGVTDIQRDNAFWNGTQNVLLFGQGVNTFRPLASFDVVGHEYGHGITDFQIGWGFTGDQGAFNEGMSDIWGAILEQRIRPNNTWRIGEQITLNNSFLRNLENTNDANALGQMSDTYLSSQYNGTNAGFEYVRSGVFSHWFYILVNGEAGTNDLTTVIMYQV